MPGSRASSAGRWLGERLRSAPRTREARIILAAVCMLLAGCDSKLPEDVVRTHSTAFADHESTSLGKQAAGLAASHPGESGFEIIRYGRQAFTARIGLTDLAERPATKLSKGMGQRLHLAKTLLHDPEAQARSGAVRAIALTQPLAADDVGG